MPSFRRRKPPPPPDEQPGPAAPEVQERRWSARRTLHPRDARPDLVRFTALPAETGPTWAPDEMSIWPVEGGRFGIDARYHGRTGAERAEHQVGRLARVKLVASVRPGPRGGATLRLGPLTHAAAWVALEAFLGRPIDDAPGPGITRDALSEGAD